MPNPPEQRKTADTAPLREESTPFDFITDGGCATEPEQLLWMAVLRQAFDDAFGEAEPIGCTESPANIEAVRMEALAFLLGIGEWADELERVCDGAGVHADTVTAAARSELLRQGLAEPSALAWGHPPDVEDVTEADRVLAGELPQRLPYAVAERVEIARDWIETDTLHEIARAYGWNCYERVAVEKALRQPAPSAAAECRHAR